MVGLCNTVLCEAITFNNISISRCSVAGFRSYGSSAHHTVLAYNCKTYERIYTQLYQCMHVVSQISQILRSIDIIEIWWSLKRMRVSPKNQIHHISYNLFETYRTYALSHRDHLCQSLSIDIMWGKLPGFHKKKERKKEADKQKLFVLGHKRMVSRNMNLNYQSYIHSVHVLSYGYFLIYSVRRNNPYHLSTCDQYQSH